MEVGLDPNVLKGTPSLFWVRKVEIQNLLAPAAGDYQRIERTEYIQD